MYKWNIVHPLHPHQWSVFSQGKYTIGKIMTFILHAYFIIIVNKCVIMV